MFLNQPLGWRTPNSTEATNQLAHVESELCWCDPIVERDEYVIRPGIRVVLSRMGAEQLCPDRDIELPERQTL